MNSVGANIPPRRAADKRQAGRQYFRESQDGQNFPGVLAMQSLINVGIARAHGLRDSQPHDADQEARSGRLQKVRPFRKGSQFGPEVHNDPREY